MPPAGRAMILRQAVEALKGEAEPRAVLLNRESGALLSEARRGIRGCVRNFDYCAGVGESFAFVLAGLRTAWGWPRIHSCAR